MEADQIETEFSKPSGNEPSFAGQWKGAVRSAIDAEKTPRLILYRKMASSVNGDKIIYRNGLRRKVRQELLAREILRRQIEIESPIKILWIENGRPAENDET
jgi:hypothetical protein